MEKEISSEHSRVQSVLPWWILVGFSGAALVSCTIVFWNMYPNLFSESPRFYLLGSSEAIVDSEARLTDILNLLKKHPSLESISLQQDQVDIEQVIAMLERHPTLRKVELLGTGTTDQSLLTLASIPNLTELNLGGTKITDLGLVNLRLATKLNAIHLHYTNIDGSCLSSLASLPNLKSLDISNTRVNDEAFRNCPIFMTLKDLSMRETAVTDECLGYIAELKSLHDLELTNNPGIHGTGLQHLKKLHQLTSLDLCGTNIGDDAIRELQSWIKLRHLNIMNTQVTSDVLFLLACNPNVTYDMPDCDEELKFIREIHNEKYRVTQLRGGYELVPKRMIPALED